MNPQEASLSKALSIDLDRKIKILQERGLSARELRLLAAFSGEELYNRDEVIFREGAKGDKLYIAANAVSRVCSSSLNATVVSRCLRPSRHNSTGAVRPLIPEPPMTARISVSQPTTTRCG